MSAENEMGAELKWGGIVRIYRLAFERTQGNPGT